MAEVRHHSVSAEVHQIDIESIRMLLVELVTGTVDGNEDDRKAAADLVLSEPALREEYARLRDAIGTTVDETAVACLQLLKNGEIVTRFELDREHPRQSLANVMPGDYSLVLETGRGIWEGCLTPRDLLWGIAFPGRALDLAADTGERPTTATREEQLLGSELILRVFPGLESGRIELTWNLGEGR